MDTQTITALQRAYLKPFSLQSQFARDYSHQVAELASRGLITTHVGEGFYGRMWRPSQAGLAFLDLKTEVL